MELTKEHFDKVVSELSTKKDAEQMEKRILSRIDEAQKELARITNTGFDDVMERLKVRERVERLEKEMTEIRSALHLTN
jgi:hypothetical protein